MDRRGFLSAILAAGVAPAVVKAQNIMPLFVRRGELLIPDPQILLPSRLLTPEWITKEALRILHDNLVLSKSAYSHNRLVRFDNWGEKMKVWTPTDENMLHGE